MTRHRLKCWPVPFQATWDRRKLHEVRADDRGFQVGDEVVLMEYDPVFERYMGREIEGIITYVSAAGSFGLPRGLCVFSLALLANRGVIA